MGADMDALAEAVIKRFPEKTDLVGNQPLAPMMDGSTKVFELTASTLKWQIDAKLATGRRGRLQRHLARADRSA